MDMDRESCFINELLVLYGDSKMHTCMGCAGMLLTLILWSLSVLTIYWPSGLTVKLVMMLQKWPMNSCGA